MELERCESVVQELANERLTALLIHLRIRGKVCDRGRKEREERERKSVCVYKCTFDIKREKERERQKRQTQT